MTTVNSFTRVYYKVLTENSWQSGIALCRLIIWTGKNEYVRYTLDRWKYGWTGKKMKEKKVFQNHIIILLVMPRKLVKMVSHVCL